MSIDTPSLTPDHPPPGLVIRATKLEDCEAINTLSNLAGFRAGTLRPPYGRVQDTRRWLENLKADDLNLVALVDGILVGQAGLQRFTGRRAHAAQLGMGVHDDHRGRRIGTALLRELIEAADQWLDLKRIELTVYTDNMPAIRLYERFGFEREGIHCGFAFKGGRLVDALAMARLRI